jgi:ribosomal protein L14E/L6E/L27E
LIDLFSSAVTQVLVDGPQSVTGIHRQVIGLRRVQLTDVVVKNLPRNSSQKNLVKAWTVSVVTLLMCIAAPF